METTELHPHKRMVEAEFKLPKLSNIELPEVDWAPVRKLTSDVLLTSLGVGVLAVRGVLAATKAAYNAGASEAEKPGTLMHTIVGAVRGDKAADAPDGGIKVQVPVLPIADYDALNYRDVLAKLDSLTDEQLAVVRDYEAAHANRSTVLNAIQARLS